MWVWTRRHWVGEKIKERESVSIKREIIFRERFSLFESITDFETETGPKFCKSDFARPNNLQVQITCPSENRNKVFDLPHVRLCPLYFWLFVAYRLLFVFALIWDQTITLLQNLRSFGTLQTNRLGILQTQRQRQSHFQKKNQTTHLITENIRLGWPKTTHH